MSRMHSRQLAKITIETEGRTFTFTAADWDLDLEQSRFDVSHLGSPNLTYMTGPSTGNLRFSIVNSASNPYGDPDSTEVGLQILRRYLKMIGAVDE